MFADHGGSSSRDRVGVGTSGGLGGGTGADAGSAGGSDRRTGSPSRRVDGRVAAAEEGVSAQGERPLAAEAGQGRAGEGGAQASRCGAAAVEPGPEDIVHDLRNEVCLDCGGALEDTGEFDEHTVEDIPPPRVDVHRYRRHRQRCRCCAKVSQPAAPPEVTDAYVGPRTRLLIGYCRAHLGISPGKSTTLLDEVFGLKLSRVGALGHIQWASATTRSGGPAVV
ncbi:MAG: IS66 family transposase zinc-finger binding domain-containing protein [Planctomycetales bacterium]|nr:IS66 family transposase zinc-finger binding domain-containing protein [Planctomycetales bacterium]